MSYYQTIYNRLRKHGLTQNGALGVLGNWDCESNCEPYRLQGDFDANRNRSKTFVANCMNGTVPKSQFVNGRVGFGLAQWTSPDRQSNLWDYWKASGKRLDDPEMQTDFAIAEMPEQAPGLLNKLKTSDDLYDCVSDVCKKFERPAVNNVDARYISANKIKGMIDLDGGGDEPDPEPTPEPEPTPTIDPKLHLRTIDRNCSGFPEVFLLQSVLYCRGCDVKPDGIFGSYLVEIVKDFQKEVFPDNPKEWDGVVGPKTWDKLLQRG